MAVDGTSHTRLAALDAASGVVDDNFDVGVDGDVTSLAASGTTLYVAGQFTAVGGEARMNVAAIDTTTGEVLPFAPTTSALVQSIDVVHGVVYLGGKFLKVNGTAQPFVAAVDAATGDLDRDFNPRPSASLLVVNATDRGVYIGGNFRSIDGAARNYVAQLNFAGDVLPWDAGLPFDSQVFDLTKGNGGRVYVGTGGHLPGGNSIYSIDPVTGDHQWQVQMDGNLQSVAVANGIIYGGGHFSFRKPCDDQGVCTPTIMRKKAVAIGVAGKVLPWAPKFNTPFGIFDFTTAGGNLYALGDFTQVNGISRPHIARFPL
jgi:trimeric autotransporter adhesin